jgi:hypothetical protein
VWLYWAATSPTPTDPSWDWIFSPRALLAAALGVMSPALLALGLWVAVPFASAGSTARLAMGALAALGLLATAGGFALTVIQAGYPMALAPDLWALYAITALVAPAFSLLAISAVRVLNGHDLLPLMLIGAGAAIVVAATGWFEWLQSQRQLQDIPVDLIGWVVTLPNGLVVVGLLAVAAGFAIAGLQGAASSQPFDASRAQVTASDI